MKFATGNLKPEKLIIRPMRSLELFRSGRKGWKKKSANKWAELEGGEGGKGELCQLQLPSPSLARAHYKGAWCQAYERGTQS